MSFGTVPCMPLWHGGSQQQCIDLFVLVYIGAMLDGLVCLKSY
jgi:hypothetical protein